MSTALQSAGAGAAAILVNYNGGTALCRALQALRASDFGSRPVLLVDNASRDGSAEAARVLPGVEVFRLARNFGFAAGANAGLKRLLLRRHDPILLLNPDTVVAPGFYGPLEQALAAGAALAGPKLVSPGAPPRLWCAGGRVTFGRNLSDLRGHRELDRGQYDRAEDVTFLPGTVWLMRSALLEDVGLLDEAFFCYVEDVDFCVRAGAQGHRLRYEPRSVVVHEGSAASGGGYTKLRKYLNAHGAFHLLRKHGTAGRWARFVAGDVLTLPLAFGYALLHGRPASAVWKARGLWDGWNRRAFAGAARAALLPGDAP